MGRRGYRRLRGARREILWRVGGKPRHAAFAAEVVCAPVVKMAPFGGRWIDRHYADGVSCWRAHFSVIDVRAVRVGA
jgi:hypothetical protein